jgi:hypothetical protein
LTIIDNEKRGLPPSMVSQEKETKVDGRRGGGRKRKKMRFMF